MFTTGQAVDGAVNYTQANAVGGKTVTGDDPNISLNQTNLTLPANQNCAQPIGSKWIANVTNWLCYVIDAAGLTYLAGAIIDDPLLLLKAIKALIFKNSTQFYAQATLPDVTNGYPCFFYNTGTTNIAITSPFGPDLIIPGATAAYNGTTWSLINPGPLNKIGAYLSAYDGTPASVDVPAGTNTTIALTAASLSGYATYDGTKFSVLASGDYVLKGTCGLNYNSSSSNPGGQCLIRMKLNRGGVISTFGGAVNYLDTLASGTNWGCEIQWNDIVKLVAGDYIAVQVCPVGMDVTVSWFGVDLTRIW